MDHTGQFEMRRFEALSNTVFGVAMTLLAYDLPKAATFTSTPDWTSLAQAYARPMIALALSFIISGIFWLSHHRRLAQAPYASRPVVMLNVLFLMTIVLLPATNGLYGAYRANSAIATVYAFHLTLIAGLNALLWYLAREHGAANYQFAAALFPAVLFAIATGIAFVNPPVAQYVMFSAFAAPFVGWLVARREKRAG